MAETLKNHYEVTIKFTMIEDSLWEVWDKLNNCSFRPLLKVDIDHIGSFKPAKLNE